MEINSTGHFVRHESKDVCYVCGKKYVDYHPWGADGESPSQHLCECCGAQFGYEDVHIEGLKEYRKKWLTQGARWFDPKHKPENWSLEEQLKNIPAEYR